MRNKFSEQLQQLDTMLIEMGSLVEEAIAIATRALETQNKELARKAIDFDEEVNQKERDIEALCLRLLLQQQPVARDLRLISASLKMITDMERIADHAADMSGITLLLADRPYIKKLEHIPQMARISAEMVQQSIDAFVTKNLLLAEDVIKKDDLVDDLFHIVKNELVEMIRENRADGEQAIDLMMVAKYYERIGDHAVNIAEWVIFSIEGRHPKSVEVES